MPEVRPSGLILFRIENATCVELSSIRNACLSEKNCKDGGFEKIKAALTE